MTHDQSSSLWAMFADGARTALPRLPATAVSLERIWLWQERCVRRCARFAAATPAAGPGAIDCGSVGASLCRAAAALPMPSDNAAVNTSGATPLMVAPAMDLRRYRPISEAKFES
jgi:hypothetical protein